MEELNMHPVEVHQPDQNEEIRTCWICFGTDEDNPTLPWVQPCRCRGSGKWVHQTCLLIWVDEKKKENRTAKIACPQCKVEYVIIFPKGDAVMNFVQVIDDLVYKTCPVVAAGVTVGIIFWAASSYGAFTIMQVFGEEEGLGMLERTDPLALLLFLPIIPTALIVMKLVRWEDYLLNWLRKGSKYPVLRHILPSLAYNEVMGQRVDINPPTSDVSSTRILVGGLVFPTIAKIFGDVFYHTEQSCLKKCILGGLTFVAIKGALKMYYKQRTYMQQCQRRVLNLHEHDSVNSASSKQLVLSPQALAESLARARVNAGLNPNPPPLLGVSASQARQEQAGNSNSLQSVTVHRPPPTSNAQ